MCTAITLGATMNQTGDLLTELGVLRRRTRVDRHAYAFTLLLFGGLILAAPLLYVTRPVQRWSSDGFDPKVSGSNPLVRIFRTEAGWVDPAHPTLIAWYWLLVLVVGFGATAWWYRRRAARVGVETDTRGLIIAGIAAFAGFFVSTFVFWRYALSLYGAWQVNLSLMFGSLALAVLVVWRVRGTLGVFLASVFGTVTFSSIAVYTNKGFSALLVIAGELLALAWLERSVLLGVVSVLFTLAAIPTTAMIITPGLHLDPSALFEQFGWGTYGTMDLRVSVLQQLLLPAAVLIIGGTIAAVRYRGKESTR
jgi:hypothetical protein